MARALSPWQRRLLLGLLAFVIVGMCVPMVERAMRGSGQYDDFTLFSSDLIFERHNLYRAYDWDRGATIGKYPPFFAAVYAPLAPLPRPVGATIYYWLNIAMCAAITIIGARAVARMSGATEDEIRALPTRAWAVPLALASGLMMSNIQTGQVNVFLLWLIVLALQAYSRGQDRATGLLLGAAAAVKLTPALFVVYFAWKRQWKVFFWSAIGVLVCWFILVPLMLGPTFYVEIMQSWMERLIPFVTEGATAEGVVGFRHTNQSPSAVLHRFFTDTPVGAGREDWRINVAAISYETMAAVMKVFNLVVLAALAWLTRGAARGRQDPRVPFELALVGIATVLVSPISWINHFVIATLAYLALMQFVRSRDPQDPQRRTVVRWWIVSTVLLVLASRPLQAFSIPFFGLAVLTALTAWVLLLHRRSETRPGLC